MDRLRIALIGAGSMASTYHYPSLAEFEDVELVGLCDLVPEKRDTLADRFNIARRYSDYRQMLDETAPEAVYILMPPHQLFDITIESLRRRIHVFLEKPPGVTTFQTEAFAREAAANGCITMVGFNRRYDPLLQIALREAKNYGQVTQVISTFYKGESVVYYNGSVDVPVTDYIHAVDTCRFLASGKARQVLSMIGQYDSPLPNAWNALVDFDNDVVGIVQGNWSTGGRVHRFEIHSPGYSAYVEQLTRLEEVADRGRVRRTRTAVEILGDEARDPRKLHGFYQQARSFVDCAKARRQPSSNFADAVLTMKLVDQIKAGYSVNLNSP